MKWAVLWKLELSKLRFLWIYMHHAITFPSGSFPEISPAPYNPLLLCLVLRTMKGSRCCNPDSRCKKQYTTVNLCPPFPPWGTHLILSLPPRTWVSKNLWDCPCSLFRHLLLWWTCSKSANIGMERGRNASKNRQAGIWSMRLEMSSSIRKSG